MSGSKTFRIWDGTQWIIPKTEPLLTIKEEGSSISTAPKSINFIGAAIAASDAVPDEIDVTVTSGVTVKEEAVSEGTNLTSLNFTGNVDVTVVGNEATVYVPPPTGLSSVEAAWSMGPDVVATTGGYKWKARKSLTINTVSASLGTAPGTGEGFTVDVRKNGTTVLSSGMAFTDGVLTVNGTLSGTQTISDGQYLEVVVHSVTGTTAKKLSVQVELS